MIVMQTELLGLFMHIKRVLLAVKQPGPIGDIMAIVVCHQRCYRRLGRQLNSIMTKKKIFFSQKSILARHVTRDT